MHGRHLAPLALTALSLAACSGGSLGRAIGTLGEDDALVIREVYGGGGNSGATYRDDFIELFNAGSAPLSLAGLSLQYLSASGAGTFGTSDTLRTELPDVLLEPGGSYLVQEARGTGGTLDLPSPDLVDPTPIAISGSAGRVVLVEGVAPLACNGVADPCSDEERGRIVDLVGFGSAAWYEGAGPAPGTSNATSAQRASNGCKDTDDNALDFAALAPTPAGSSEPPTTCGADGGTEADGGALEDGGTDGGEDGGEPDASADAGAPVRIHDIQGAAHISPMAGAMVTGVEGIVTERTTSGFYLQDPLPDALAATSEAILVYTASAPTVVPGDRVRVAGRVTEFRPGCNGCAPSASAYDNLTITEIVTPSIELLAQGVALPEAIVIGEGGVLPPLTFVDEGGTGSAEDPSSTFDPSLHGLDFFESLEAMRVALPRPVVAGPTVDFGTSREVVTSVPGARSRLTARSGLRLDTGTVTPDHQPERFMISDTLGATIPDLNVGDVFDGIVVGVLDYAFAKYLVLPRALPSVQPGGLVRETVNLETASGAVLDIATFNVENLGGNAAQARFDATAAIIVTGLGAPDLVVLEEMQDDNGATNDTVVSSSVTASRLLSAISAAGGPAYAYRDIAPSDDDDGGEPGGNIRVGFLYREDRGLAFVHRAGGDATRATIVTETAGVPHIDVSPGRISPTSAAFSSSRKPVVAELTFEGETFFVVGCHFNSKGGDDPTFGRFQPPVRSSEIQRSAQAEIVAAFIGQIRAIDPGAHIVVAGDINDFRESEVVSTLLDAGLVDLVDTLPDDERYGYVYQGASQLLDHVLVSESLMDELVGFDIVHLNSEFAVQQSDHDPSVARLAFASEPLLDGGMPEDAGVDAAIENAGIELDATIPDDAAAPADASSPEDASTQVDATMPGDATLPSDASIPGDTEAGLPPADAAHPQDGSASADGGDASADGGDAGDVVGADEDIAGGGCSATPVPVAGSQALLALFLVGLFSRLRARAARVGT